MNNPLYCAKCQKQVQNVTGQQLMNQQQVVLSFSCHGVSDRVVLPIMEMQQPGAIIVGCEFRRCTMEYTKV